MRCRPASILALALAAIGCAPRGVVTAPVCVTTSSALAPPPPPPAATPAPAVAPPPADGDEVLARMEDFYAPRTPFEADLAIETSIASHATSRLARAKLTFAGPGRYRVDFANGDRLVAGGGLLTWVDATRGAGFQQAIGADHLPALLAFARPRAVLAASLRVQRFDGARLNAPGTDVIVGTPLRPHPAAAKILLYVRPSGEAARVVVVLPSGNRVRVDVSNVAPTAARAAAFAPPAGQPVAASAQNPAASPFVTTFP